MTYELQPQYDSRKSFYGKARVDQNDSMSLIRLYSYDTHVASIETVTNPKRIGQAGESKRVATVYGTHSATTLRHIKEFLKQNGFRAESKAQIERDYMEGK